MRPQFAVTPVGNPSTCRLTTPVNPFLRNTRAKMTAPDMCKFFCIPDDKRGALEKRLYRLRKNTLLGWIQNPHPATREATFLYQIGIVLPKIADLIPPEKRPLTVG